METRKADVTVHIDETLDHEHREEVRRALCNMEGVMEVRVPDQTPHLMVVEYDPLSVSSEDILHRVTRRGLHAELIGL